MTDRKNFVLPKTYLIGYTALDFNNLSNYLYETGQTDFLKDMTKAGESGISDGEILCSFYAKLCYASLVIGKNENVTKIRSVEKNIEATIDSGHGSVFEHCYLNFVVHNCSRVFTHELVRHRVGTSFSQTSGRYVRTDKLDVVVDPILEPAYDLVEDTIEFIEEAYRRIEVRMGIGDSMDFHQKKKITSAMRRLLPNGQANEIGFGINLRSLRHLIELRTNRAAEWEIRLVFNQIFDVLKDKYRLMFRDATKELVEGAYEIKFANKKI